MTMPCAVDRRTRERLSTLFVAQQVLNDNNYITGSSCESLGFGCSVEVGCCKKYLVDVWLEPPEICPPPGSGWFWKF